MGNKPKNSATGIPVRDRFQTPPYAVDLLFQYAPAPEFHPHHYPDIVVYEPACGEGILVNTLLAKGRGVIASDLMQGLDFFNDAHLPDADDYDVHITNPPYSLKYKWLQRCYDIGKSFALLMPSDTMFAKTAQDLFREWGIYVILPERRINFKPPVQGWQGSSAQFHSSWFVWSAASDFQGIRIIQAEYPKYTLEQLLERIEQERIG